MTDAPHQHWLRCPAADMSVVWLTPSDAISEVIEYEQQGGKARDMVIDLVLVRGDCWIVRLIEIGDAQ